jgi:hypothetical protein
MGFPIVGIEYDEDGYPIIVFPSDLTADQIRQVRVRIATENADEEAVLLQAYQAFSANQAYVAAPIAATNTARISDLETQMKRITNQMNQVLKYLAGDLLEQ